MRVLGESAVTVRPFLHQFGKKRRAFLAFLLLAGVSAHAANRYWDTTAGLNNGVGGSGTWGTTFSSTSTGDASLTTAGSADATLFQGSAGTITLGQSVTVGSLTFNVSDYVITASDSTNRSITASSGIQLATNVNLTVGNGESAPRTLTLCGIGMKSGADGGTLTLNASVPSGSGVTRVNFGTGNSAVGVPIQISGTGIAQIVSVTSGVYVQQSVKGNGSMLLLGASNSSNIDFSGSINNGTGTVRIIADSLSNGGTVSLSSALNVWGDTELANASTGVLNLQGNTLPTTTTLRFGAVTGAGNSIVDLNGHDQTLGQLTNGVTSGGTIKNSVSGTLSTLTLGGSDTSAAAFSGQIVDGSSSAKVAVVRNGQGTTTFSGNNTYSGGTTIESGALLANTSTGSTGTGSVKINGGRLGGTGTVSGTAIVNPGGTLAPGDPNANSGIGTLKTVTAQWNGGADSRGVLEIQRSGSSNDLLTGTSLTINADSTQPFEIDILPLTGVTRGDTFVIATFTNITNGSLIGPAAINSAKSDFVLPSPGGGLEWDVTASGTQGSSVSISVTAAPEPATTTAAAWATATALARRRSTRVSRRRRAMAATTADVRQG